MNVVITNKQDNILAGLDIEIIKTLRGEFEVDEIISTFSKLFFARMILDITAIKNFNSITNFQKLSIGIPVDKIILLLPNDPMYTSVSYLSQLISMGYYNFTTNLDGIKYLLNTPNTYKEVAHLHRIVSAPSISSTSNNTIVNNNINKIIGFKNVTDGAGSTTLVYLLKKQLSQHYGIDIVAIEVNKKDFIYFDDESFISTDKNNLATELIKYRNKGTILIDLNDSDPGVCDEVYYLLEPSVIKFNKLIKRNIYILEHLKNKRIILNKTLLSQNDVMRFEKETGLKVFSVIGPIDDRREDLFLSDIITKLGFIK